MADSVVFNVGEPLAFFRVPVLDDGDVVDVSESGELFSKIGFGRRTRNHHEQPEKTFLFVDVSSRTLITEINLNLKLLSDKYLKLIVST